ncbi:hypothetical protein NNJEOMEG_03832 [Fundidesulfovibrio magnetotacticus]|uniref:Glycosyltransferase RgtA/B/C/D-like domain-containing protein n=1 Tax=Fundidesulfovibrio magnetotacticus TaxID=2730080 RepID=A0A6V8M151_9BACT|nr:hypothetical protein NNJEOMEG_03832 [Fundidesulfovibrio magnetotacticus]
MFPLQQGRDFHTYLSYFTQFFREAPADHQLMLFRTPGAPLFFGLLDRLGGPALVDAGLNLLYAASLAALFAAARRAWGTLLASCLLGLLALLPSYNWAWHTVATESLTAAGTAFFAAALLGAFARPGPWRWAVCGAWAFALVMARPSNQLAVAACLACLAVPGLPARRRLALGASMLAAYCVLAGAWMAHNGLRYGEFTVSRGGAGLMPGHRVFLWDRLMAPGNGPASARLAEAVAADLLPRPEYRAKGVDLELFFAAGDENMFADLLALSDRAFGWESNFSTLQKAALEGVAARPLDYLAGVRDTLRLVFSVSEVEAHERIKARWPTPEIVKARRAALGLPVEAPLGFTRIMDQSSAYWLESGSGRFAPTPEERRAVREETAAMAARYPDFMEAMRLGPWPTRVWHTLAAAWSWFFALVPLGLGCLAERDPGRRGSARAALALWAAGLWVLGVTYLGVDAVFQLRSPFDPWFLLAALAGARALAGRVRGSAASAAGPGRA